tara:strand:- start:281 stop:709 length:429 start_codon:yes stop_codon:yes gene_type:complete
MCPDVFFAKNQRIYISTDDPNTSFENTYNAKINNYSLQKCILNENDFSINLSILFMISLIEKNEISLINLPYYVALLDEQRKIIDMQYFLKTDKLDYKDLNVGKIELVDSKKIVFNLSNNYSEDYSILLGFMIDKERENIIN